MKPTQAQIEAALKSLWNEEGVVISEKQMTKAITAAAEVGEQRQEGMAWIAHEAKLRAIERCARVAEQTITNSNVMGDGRARNIAAAIRTLKDQP